MAPVSATTMAGAGDSAEQTLLSVFYAGHGTWRECDRPDCNRVANDWGADSATNALYLRWTVTHSAQIRTVMVQLLKSAPSYTAACQAAPCGAWSDTTAWDAVAIMRERTVTGTGGACRDIPYQAPQPSALMPKR